jgi:glutathione S-transferase
VDAQLDGRDWIAGTRSIADPYLLVTLRWARKFGVDLSGLANVERYITRMEDDSGVRAAVQAES